MGEAGDQRQEEGGPVHEWLWYLSLLRGRHSGLTEQEIADRMGLTARSRVSRLLRHAPPSKKEQASALLDALGAFEWEKTTALKLWQLARDEFFGDAVSRSRRTDKSHQPSPLFAEVARSVIPTNGLEGRARELDELAAFCADEERSYTWWQAEAWAGKTALLAWFVVNPPPGVVPVSFFITGRQAGQDTSLAFLRDVTAQLEALSGASQLETAVRDGMPYLHWLLRESARLVSRDGQRLVLVVDGLDEDASIAVDRQSIASMLPKNPGHGSKVIVSGRPNPRLPSDTPADHPLRDISVVRVLPVSEYAIARRDIAAAELNQLLDGSSELAKDMVGYLVAAGGSVSAEDIAELTGHMRRDVEKILNSATGRTFARRPVFTTRGEQDPGLIFSHIELSEEASSQLGTSLVKGYREKLHQWAGGYRDRGWPRGTPFYLLRGYGEMLQREHDNRRFAALAADGTRIDRIMEVTGSDADAAAEVDAAFGFAVVGRDADLAAVALLAYQRDRLADRNRSLPAQLPAAWARAGQPRRAEAMARSISGSALTIEALALVSIAMHDIGEKAGADRLKDAAFDELQEIDAEDREYPRSVGAVAAALARAGDSVRAHAMLVGLEDARARDREIVEVATCAGKAGQPQQAMVIAATANGVRYRAIALAAAAEGLAVAGLADHAMKLARKAEALARSSDADAYTRNAAIPAVARAVAILGRSDLAEELAGSLSEPGARGEALSAIAAGLATPERRELAMQLITTANVLFDEAEAEARTHNDSSFSRQHARNHLAQAYAGAGEVSAAEDLVGRPYPVSSTVDSLIGVAEKLACGGESAHAERILDKAETMARGGSPLHSLGEALIKIAKALIDLGATRQAADILRDLETVMTGPHRNEVPLRELAFALAAAGVGERCAAVARSIDDLSDQKNVLAWSAELLAQAGEADQAESLVDGLSDADGRSRALASIAVERVVAGRWAAALSVTEAIPDHHARHHATADIAAVLARAGRVEEALELSDLPDRGAQGKALAGIARGLAETGNVARATEIARDMTHPWWRVTALAWIADALAAADTQAQAEVLADAEQFLKAALRSDSEEYARAQKKQRNVIFFPSDTQATACWTLAEAYARAGQVERAMRAADLVPHPKSSRRALENVAVILAEAGHPEAATGLVATGSFRSPQAEVQARVAAALARVGQAKRARDLLIIAIRTGRWDSWIPALGEISLTDLLRLAESIRRDYRLALLAMSD